MSVPALTDWQVQVGELVLGPGTPYDLAEVTGLDELADVVSDDVSRPVNDGDFESLDTLSGRTITLSIEAAGDVDVTYGAGLAALRAELQSTRTGHLQLWFKLPTLPVLGTRVKVRRRRIPTTSEYELGLATVDVMLRSPDPTLTGDPHVASSGFARRRGGLRFPLFTNGTDVVAGLDFGDPGNELGMVETHNAGNAAAWPVFDVAGPTPPEGFEILEPQSGARLRYTGQVPIGSTLRLASADGSVRLDETDRWADLTIREWTPVPPGESLLFLFTPLGGATTAVLTVSTAPTYA